MSSRVSTYECSNVVSLLASPPPCRFFVYFCYAVTSGRKRSLRRWRRARNLSRRALKRHFMIEGQVEGKDGHVLGHVDERLALSRGDRVHGGLALALAKAHEHEHEHA
jgi:hypothetical protein